MVSECSPLNKNQTKVWDAVITLLCVICMVILFLFSQNIMTVWPRLHAGEGRYEQFLLVSHTLLLLPLIIVLPLAAKKMQFGFELGTAWSWRFYGIFTAVMLPVILFVSARPDFRNYYPIYAPAAVAGWPLVYHLVLYSMYLFSWELFFRGYFTHSAWRLCGWAGIVLQAVVFAAMHLGKPVPEVLGSFIAGIAMAIIAVRAHSFLPGCITHIVISGFMDICVVWRNLHP